MNRITYKDLKFDDYKIVNDFIIKYKIELFLDADDIIICYQSSALEITNSWNDIVTETAYYFQSNLVDEIMSKNLLLVFCAYNDIDINIKKEIQSDTYCCRKIVRSNVKNLESSIKELIFYDTVQVVVTKTSSLKYLIHEKHPEVFILLGLENETE